jgi:hypothetical protein
MLHTKQTDQPHLTPCTRHHFLWLKNAAAARKKEYVLSQKQTALLKAKLHSDGTHLLT